MAKQKVQGFGGFFFRAKDPKALALWYEQTLGVLRTPTDYDQACWMQEQGPTVFEPFPEETDYFGDRTHPFMLNFRVSDLAAMIAQLREAGVVVEEDPQEYPNGIFARLADPEGNPIALWQPKSSALS